MTLSLFTSAQLEPGTPEPARKLTIEERFLSWSKQNQHVLDELLRLARDLLSQGATYISTKALWESCRVSCARIADGGSERADFVPDEPYKLNNTYTSSAARWLIEQEPRLADVIELRQRRAK